MSNETQVEISVERGEVNKPLGSELKSVKVMKIEYVQCDGKIVELEFVEPDEVDELRSKTPFSDRQVIKQFTQQLLKAHRESLRQNRTKVPRLPPRLRYHVLGIHGPRNVDDFKPKK